MLFVIKTPAIQKEEVKEETVTEEKKKRFGRNWLGCSSKNGKAGAIPHLITDTKKTEFHRNSVLIPVTESG